jgi:hypothetical protein
MAAGKTQFIYRQLPAITNSVWATGVLTVTFASSPQLIAGNTFKVNFAGRQNFESVEYTVVTPTGNNVTVTMAAQPANSFSLIGQNAETKFFNTGSIATATLGGAGTGSAAVLQAYSVGAASSTVVLSLSLDGSHWIAGPTGINTVGANSTVAETTVNSNWAYIKLDGTSIGASTSVVFMKSC